MSQHLYRSVITVCLALFLGACNSFDAAKVQSLQTKELKWIESDSRDSIATSTTPTWGNLPSIDDKNKKEASYADRISSIIKEKFISEPALRPTQEELELLKNKTTLKQITTLQLVKQFEEACQNNDENKMNELLDKIDILELNKQEAIFKQSFPTSVSKFRKTATLLEMYAEGSSTNSQSALSFSTSPAGDFPDVTRRLCKHSKVNHISDQTKTILAMMIFDSQKIDSASILATECGIDPNYSPDIRIAPSPFQMAISSLQPGLAFDMLKGIMPADPYVLDQLGNTPIALLLESIGTNSINPDIINIQVVDSVRTIIRALVERYESDKKTLFLKSSKDGPALKITLETTFPESLLSSIKAGSLEEAKSTYDSTTSISQLNESHILPYIEQASSNLRTSCTYRGFKNCTKATLKVTRNESFSFTSSETAGEFNPSLKLRIEISIYADELPISQLVQDGDVHF